jgi:hypothetical protein
LAWSVPLPSLGRVCPFFQCKWHCRYAPQA